MYYFMQPIIIALLTMNDSIPLIFKFVLPMTHPTSIHYPNNDLTTADSDMHALFLILAVDAHYVHVLIMMLAQPLQTINLF